MKQFAQHRLALSAIAAMACLGAIALINPALAQSSWPTQPVKIIVPYAPGGTADISARMLQPELSKMWGQPVIVENRAGASTQIGTEAAKNSTDGHTLLMTAAPFIVNTALFARLPYDPFKDFKYITVVVRSGMVMTTAANSPFKSMADVVAQGKTANGFSSASAGNGTMSHMGAELLASMQGLSLTHVPYRGTPPAQSDVLGGTINVMFDNPSSAMALIKDGRLRALAYTDRKRSKAFPTVPTMAESGIAGFELVNWFGLVAPAAMSDTVLDRINADVLTVLRRREIIERFGKEGVEVGGIPREAFGAFLAMETVKWTKIVKARNIKAD